MKTTDANDPLNDKDLDEKQTENQNKKPLKEEKSQQAKTEQEKVSDTPEGTPVASPGKDTPAETLSEKPEPTPEKPESKQDTPEPGAETPDPSPEPGAETPEPSPESEAETPDPSPEPEAKTPEPSPEPEAKTPEPSPEPGAETPDPSPEPEAETPDPSPEPEAETPESSPEPEAETPESLPEPEAETPEPSSEPAPEPASESPDPAPEKPSPETPEEVPVALSGKDKPAVAASEKPDPAAEKPEPAAEKSESGPDKPEAAPEKTGSISTKEEAEQLIDDHEEKQKNESYDDDLDHEEHESSVNDDPKEEHESGKVEEERVNFSLLSKEDLVKLMREKLDNPGKGNIRKDVEEIKQAFYDKHSATLEEKKKHFLEEGGNLEDFKPADDPLETEIRELLKKYKSLKAEFTRQLEKTKQENLVKKQEILEDLRRLMEGQENFEITFRKFKDLQRKWFSAGVVPQQNLKDLWDSYNYFVDKFNDYVRINRDLRALDLKKNLELKIQLCERTEELDQEPNIVQAFKTLQKHHARWREIGPVPRDNRDEVWDRFKLATSVINKKHQEYHSRLKESLYENLERKVDLCEKVEAIAENNYDSHGTWVEKTNQVLEIQKTWKTIGYAPKKDNNAIYARFRKACDTFFGNKARFYAAAYEEQKENLRMKVEITEKAETLCESEDWKETTTQLMRSQRQWKERGAVPRRDSDKLWRRFRAACDTFFNRKSKYFEDIDSTFDENLKAKESLVTEMDSYTPSDDRKANLEALEDFQSRFNAIGYVPSAKKDIIKEQFRLAQDRLLERIGMDESERSIFKFRNRIRGMMQAPRSEMKLNFERDKLVNKLQQLRNDIGVWENNIGFFKQSDSSEETIQGFNEKIEAAHGRIKVLEEKIRILDNMENAN